MSFVKKKMTRWRKQMWKDKPTDEKDVVTLAHKMFKFVVKNPDCHGLEDFIVDAKISYGELKDLAAQWPYFAKVLSITHSLISSRVQKGWMRKELSSDYARRYIEMYNEAYREVLHERLRIREEADVEARKIEVIEIPSYAQEDKSEARA